MAGAGKGSRPRKVDLKKFSLNYDKIFGQTKKINSELTKLEKISIR